MKQVIKFGWPLLLLAVLIVLIFHDVSFLRHPLKYDNFNIYLPYKMFSSFYFENGKFPGWNPFQSYGYPGYCDTQSGTFFPLFWIISLFGKYGLAGISLELVFAYLIAGVGMYLFAYSRFKSQKISLLLGLMYGASGFSISTAQLLVFIYGYAWFPWLILMTLTWLSQPTFKNSIKLALILALQITSSSPAYTIVNAYVLFMLFLFYLAYKKENETAKYWQLALSIVSVLACLIVLLLPYLQSLIDFLPYMSRSTKLEYNKFLLSNPLSFATFTSFLFPVSMLTKTSLLEITDISLRSSYISLLGFFGFCVAMIKEYKRFTVKLSFLAVVVFFLLALGDQFFLYKYLYHLPGFGLFRHPSFFRGYAMFFMLLLAGYGIQHILHHPVRLGNMTGNLLMYSFLAIVAITAFTSYLMPLGHLGLFFKEQFMRAEVHSSTFLTHIAVNGYIILALVVLGFILNRLRVNWFITLCVVTFLDLAILSTISSPVNTCYPVEYNRLNEAFNKLPTKIDQDKNYTPMGELTDTTKMPFHVPEIWINKASFFLQPSSVAYNATQFRAKAEADKSGSIDAIGLNSLMWSPKYSVTNWQEANLDGIWGVSEGFATEQLVAVEAVEIGFNQFTAHVSNSHSSPLWLVLNQNYHHLWQASLNKEILEIKKVNNMVMGVQIPSNTEGQLHFRYSTAKMQVFSLLSLISYCVVGVWLILHLRKKATETKFT